MEYSFAANKLLKSFFHFYLNKGPFIPSPEVEHVQFILETSPSYLRVPCRQIATVISRSFTIAGFTETIVAVKLKTTATTIAEVGFRSHLQQFVLIQMDFATVATAQFAG